MKLKFIPCDFNKDWMLYASALLTWSLVTYLSLRQSEINVEFIFRGIGHILFLALFLTNISSSNAKSSSRYRVLIAFQVIIVWSLIYFDRYQLSPILLVLVATQLAAVFDRSKTLLILLLINIGFYVIGQANDHNVVYSVMIFFMLQIFAYSTMEITLREQYARENLAAINQELLATRFLLKESSQRKERLRISRDLHDVIGHQLTALSLNLEVAKHKVPDEFKPLLQQNLTQAKTLLSDVRNVVKEMRNDEQFDLIAVLTGLVEQLPDCALTVKSVPNINSLSLKQQLVFSLQEGISNALRHGKANQLLLDSAVAQNRLTITLADNGKKQAAIQFGSGLNGMQERLAEFNGQVELLSNESGCTLKIEVEDCYD